jgi:trans-aconitate methyltransferase
MGNLVPIGTLRKRREIEAQCSCTIRAWHDQYDHAVRRMKNDVDWKIATALSDRDKALAELNGDEAQELLPDALRGHS